MTTARGTRRRIGREATLVVALTVLLAVTFDWVPPATVALPPVPETLFGLAAGVAVAVAAGRLADRVPETQFVTHDGVFILVLVSAAALGLVVFSDGLPYVLQVAVLGIIWGSFIETAFSVTATAE